MKTATNVPNLIPEFSKFLLVLWIKSELGLWIDDDPRIESSTAEHHCRLDVGISVKNTLWKSR